MSVMLDLVIYSDCLRPWCFDAAVRLGRPEADFAGRIRTANSGVRSRMRCADLAVRKVQVLGR